MPSHEFYPIIIVKKLNSLKHLVRTTVAESHNYNNNNNNDRLTAFDPGQPG